LYSNPGLGFEKATRDVKHLNRYGYNKNFEF
jgi:hypothetical protein